MARRRWRTERSSAGATTFTTSSLALGAHSITAVYGGNTDFATSTSSALTETSPRMARPQSWFRQPIPRHLGQSVVFTAVEIPNAPGVGTPTGTVTFKDGTTTLATETLTGGTATFFTSRARDRHSLDHSNLRRQYSFQGQHVSRLSQTVNQASSTTSVTSSANPSVFGQSVTFTAQVSAVSPGAGTPTGTVTFKDGSTTLGTGSLSAGTANFTTAALAVGSHSITAVYGGDTHFKTSTSPPLIQTVSAATVTLSDSQSASSAETSSTAIQTDMPPAPSVRDLALNQVASEQREHRLGTSRQTAERKAQIKVTETVSVPCRKVPFSRTPTRRSAEWYSRPRRHH